MAKQPDEEPRAFEPSYEPMVLGPMPTQVVSHGCGCTHYEYEGGRTEDKPCVPHALLHAGTMLQAAAERMLEEREARLGGGAGV